MGQDKNASNYDPIVGQGQARCSEIIDFEEGLKLSQTDTKRGKKQPNMYVMSSSIVIAFVVIFFQ